VLFSPYLLMQCKKRILIGLRNLSTPKHTHTHCIWKFNGVHSTHCSFMVLKDWVSERQKEREREREMKRDAQREKERETECRFLSNEVFFLFCWECLCPMGCLAVSLGKHLQALSKCVCVCACIFIHTGASWIRMTCKIFRRQSDGVKAAKGRCHTQRGLTQSHGMGTDRSVRRTL